MFDSLSRIIFFTLARSSTLGRFASRYGMRDGGFARRFVAGETVKEAIDTARRLTEDGLNCTLNYLGESVTSSAAARASADAYAGILREVSDAGLPCQVSVKLTQLGLAIEPEQCGVNLRQVLYAAGDRVRDRARNAQSECRRADPRRPAAAPPLGHMDRPSSGRQRAAAPPKTAVR
jgi:proline dehydrogenase